MNTDLVNRMKFLRKELLNMNQADFASPLGLKQSTIGNYESGARGVSDATILAICREYGVNEQWLRNGEGAPFVPIPNIPNTMISELALEYDLDLFDQNLITEYLKLDKDSRRILKNYIKQVFLSYDEDVAIKEELASYEQQLRSEKRGKSSASNTTKEKKA